jgi:hypothetical protein
MHGLQDHGESILVRGGASRLSGGKLEPLAAGVQPSLCYYAQLLNVMEWFENDDFWRDFYPFMFSDERFAATPDEVSRIPALTQCTGGSVLDLCCGPDRHSIELARAALKSPGLTV